MEEDNSKLVKNGYFFAIVHDYEKEKQLNSSKRQFL